MVHRRRLVAIGGEALQKPVECLSIRGMRARSGSLAGSGAVHRDKGEPDTIFTVMDDFCHDDDRAVWSVRFGLRPLESDHEQGTQEPAFVGSEIKPCGTDIADIVGHRAAAVPEVCHHRRRLLARRLSLIGDQQRFQPIFHFRTLRGLIQSADWLYPGQAELRRDRGRYIWPGLPIIRNNCLIFPVVKFDLEQTVIGYTT